MEMAGGREGGMRKMISSRFGADPTLVSMEVRGFCFGVMLFWGLALYWRYNWQELSYVIDDSKHGSRDTRLWRPKFLINCI